MGRRGGREDVNAVDEEDKLKGTNIHLHKLAGKQPPNQMDGQNGRGGGFKALCPQKMVALLLLFCWPNDANKPIFSAARQIF
jgi:hypothetical protein